MIHKVHSLRQGDFVLNIDTKEEATFIEHFQGFLLVHIGKGSDLGAWKPEDCTRLYRRKKRLRKAA